MAVATRLQFSMLAMESVVNDMGTASMPHKFEYPPPSLNSGSPEYATGTGDNQFDIVWSDERTLAAAAESLDLYGVLTTRVGGSAINGVELCGIVIINKATAAASRLLVGAGAAPSFTGLFGATGDIIKVPASGLFVWFAPLDNGGCTITNTTADILYVDAGAATITYQIGLLIRSA